MFVYACIPVYTYVVLQEFSALGFFYVIPNLKLPRVGKSGPKYIVIYAHLRLRLVYQNCSPIEYWMH